MKNFFLTALLSIAMNSYAQTYDWAGQIGGAGFDTGYGITVDAEGNVITIGSYQGTADLDPGPAVLEFENAGFDDIFLTKVDPSGNLIWAKKFGGTSFDIGYDVVTDAEGNIYSTGYFSETVDFDPGSGTFNMTSSGLYDCFVSKLDPSGAFLWAKQFGGSEFEMGFAVTLDNQDNVIITGRFNGSADFDPGTASFELTPVGSYDAFVAKLNSSGEFIWAKQFGSGTDDEGHGVVVDADDNIYSTGFFWGVCDFDPGADVNNLTSAGNFDIYISKLDANGDFVWAKRIGGAMEDQGLAIARDNTGALLLTGYFSGTADFDPDAGTLEFTSVGGYDAYVCKLDSDGVLAWAHPVGGFGNDKGYSIDVDGQGAVYSMGNFEFSGDFDPGDGTDFLIAVGGDDCYQQILDADGNFLWAAQIGSGGDDVGRSLEVDAFGNMYSTGYFEQTADLDPGDETDELTSFGNYDVFMQKLVQCSNSTSTSVATACNSYTSPSGNYTWTESGTYLDTIPNSTGCDSLMTIELTINTQEASITFVDGSLVASPDGASYQWTLCDGTPIPGATDQTYTPAATASYAVIVTVDCSGTSDCYDYIVGLEDVEFENSLQIDFNSSTGRVYVQFDQYLPNVTTTIMNPVGQVVNEVTYIDQQHIEFDLPSSAGVYLIQIQSEDRQAVLRLLRN